MCVYIYIYIYIFVCVCSAPRSYPCVAYSRPDMYRTTHMRTDNIRSKTIGEPKPVRQEQSLQNQLNSKKEGLVILQLLRYHRFLRFP